MKRVLVSRYVHHDGCCPQEGLLEVEVITQIDDNTNSFVPPVDPYCATSQVALWKLSQSVEVIREMETRR